MNPGWGGVRKLAAGKCITVTGPKEGMGIPKHQTPLQTDRLVIPDKHIPPIQTSEKAFIDTNWNELEKEQSWPDNRFHELDMTDREGRPIPTFPSGSG